jgi:hypothetical protein
MKTYFIENDITKEKFEYVGPFIDGTKSYVLDIHGKLIESETMLNYGEFELIECCVTDDYNVIIVDDKQTPEEFINSECFHLTVDCKRDLNEIYEALKKYATL